MSTATLRTPTHALSVAKILHPQHTTLRARINDRFIKKLAGALEEGQQLPPPLVFFDGQRYWLADGEASIRALLLHKRQTLIECEVRRGTRQDAIVAGLTLHSSANRQWWEDDDRSHAARIVLADPEMHRWSNVRIARLVGYASETSIRNLRLLIEEQQEARAMQKSQKATSHQCEVAPPPQQKIRFDDTPAEQPKGPIRLVQVEKGPNAGKTYELAIKPKKDLPQRYALQKARRQSLRSGPKLGRQIDMGGGDAAEVYLQLAEGRRRGISEKEVLEKYWAEMGY